MDVYARLDRLERELATLRAQLAATDVRRHDLSLRGLGRRLERARLTEDLDGGGTAAAVLLDGDDSDTDREIEVSDQSQMGPFDEGDIVTVWWREKRGSTPPGVWLILAGEDEDDQSECATKMPHSAEDLPGFDDTKTQILASVNGCLQWKTVSTCPSP